MRPYVRPLNPWPQPLASIPITLFGLVLITFLIGRVVPIDPVLAVVGDRAPQDVVERTRQARWASIGRCPSSSSATRRQLVQGDLGQIGDDQQPRQPPTSPASSRPRSSLRPSRCWSRRCIGIPLGVLGGGAAGQLDRPGDPGRVPVSGHSIPVFVLALVSRSLVFYAIARLGARAGPAGRAVSGRGAPGDRACC